MYHNGNKYDKLFHNGNLYTKAFRNENLIFGTEKPIIDIPFQNSISNIIPNGIGMVQAGNMPTFATGRKGNDYCAVFNGSQSIKTVTPLAIGNDKMTVSFWLKTASTALGIVTELSENFNGENAFVVFINETAVNSVFLGDNKSGANYGKSELTVNNNTWHFVTCTIDRALPSAQQNSIYIDGVLNYTQISGNELNGNWDAFPLYVGQRAGTAFGFNGSLQDFKIYNRVLSQQEITDLFNS